MAEVFRLNEGSGGAEVLRKLADRLEEGKIESLVVANEPFSLEKRLVEDSLGTIHRYWFLKGSLGCLDVLGLLDYSKEIIRKMMFDDIDLIRGE